MATRPPIQVGSVSFATKKALTEFTRSILYRYQPGHTVTDPADHEFLLGLLSLHRQAAKKIGVGVQSFQVESQWGNQGFWLTRTDGTRTDWSFVFCISPPSRAQEVTKVFRHEIRQQIVEAKALAFVNSNTIYCEVTGIAITQDTAHVDHNPTFESLLATFLTQWSLKIEQIEISESSDGSLEAQFIDRDLAKKWSSFHRQHARLRLVSQQANLSLLRRRVKGA